LEAFVNKKDIYKVQIKFGDADVNVEGAESGVVKIVEALSDVLRSTKRAGNAAIQLSGAEFARRPLHEMLQTSRTPPTDIRSFFEEKQPSSDIEAAAASAYYYQYLAPEDQRRSTIDSASLQEAFRLAKRPLPARTIYTLTNARNAGYLDFLEGGQFRLNPVGYNLVEHGLGQQQAAEESKAKKKKKKAKNRHTKSA
jgi:hypothetical protein